MIKLTDRYYIDFDKYNIILKEKKITKSGKNKGEPRLEAQAFAPLFSQIADYMVQKEYMSDDSKEIQSLKDVQKRIDKLTVDITNNIKRIAKDEIDFLNSANNKWKENHNENN